MRQGTSEREGRRHGRTDGHLAISYISYMLINVGDKTSRITQAHYVSILHTLMNGNMNVTIREHAVTLGHE